MEEEKIKYTEVNGRI